MWRSVFADSSKTFRPLKSHPEEQPKRQQLSDAASATIGSGDLRHAVTLPQGEELNEWLAANTIDFFNSISICYGTVSEFCTNTSCPEMSAGPTHSYLWADGPFASLCCSGRRFRFFLIFLWCGVV